jgi:hypothetical protein
MELLNNNNNNKFHIGTVKKKISIQITIPKKLNYPTAKSNKKRTIMIIKYLYINLKLLTKK